MSTNARDGEHHGIFTIEGELPLQGFPRDMTYEPVRGPIWTVSEGIYRTIFLEGENGIVAFDTFSTPGGARSYRQALERLFPDKPIHTIVYSHDHLDHTGYAADLKPDAEIIAHELCGNVIEARQSDGQLPPTETFSGERASYSVDGVSFELIYPGPTHGDGNLAVHLPEQDVLFMVDTVIPGVCYTFIPDWHLRPYLGNMRRLTELEWDLFIPGHFWSTDPAGFEHNLQFYEDLAETAERAVDEGVEVTDLEEVKTFADQHLKNSYGDLFRYEAYIGMNLMRYMYEYITGGWGIEGNRPPREEPL